MNDHDPVSIATNSSNDPDAKRFGYQSGQTHDQQTKLLAPTLPSAQIHP
jgi:hypothetical protein